MSSYPPPPQSDGYPGPVYGTYAGRPVSYPPPNYPAPYPRAYPANPDDPWGTFAAPPRPVYWPGFKDVVTLGRFVIAAVAVVALTDFVEIIGRAREYSLAGDLQSDFYSVSPDRINASDDFIRAARLTSIGVTLLAGVLFIVWFYRARWNAGAYGTHEQRRSQGWAIGSWICPFIALFYPYQMTTDVVVASEADPGSPTRYATIVPLVRVWWMVWLIDSIFNAATFRVAADSATFDEVRTADIVNIVSSLLDIAAAALMVLVVLRIMRAQRRWPAKVQTLAYPNVAQPVPAPYWYGPTG